MRGCGCAGAVRTVAAGVVLAGGRRALLGGVGEQGAAVGEQRRPLLAPVQAVRDARLQEPEHLPLVLPQQLVRELGQRLQEQQVLRRCSARRGPHRRLLQRCERDAGAVQRCQRLAVLQRVQTEHHRETLRQLLHTLSHRHRQRHTLVLTQSIFNVTL